MADETYVRLRFIDTTRTALGNMRVVAHPAPDAELSVRGLTTGVVVSHGDVCGDHMVIHLTHMQASGLIEMLKEAAREYAR